MELIVNEKNDITIEDSIKNLQEKFLNKTIGEVVNNAVNFGIKAVLPDTLEDKVIDIKNNILSNLGNTISEEVSQQVNNIKKLEGAIEKWNEAYKEKDLNEMTKSYKKIEKYMKQTIPLESTIDDARKIENLQKLIQNKGGDFNISEEELNLSKKLIN